MLHISRSFLLHHTLSRPVASFFLAPSLPRSLLPLTWCSLLPREARSRQGFSTVAPAKADVDSDPESFRFIYRCVSPGGLLYRLLRRAGVLEIPKFRIQRAAVFQIEAIIDSSDYGEFYRVCQMPDSMSSWYLVTELHLWMLFVRLSENGAEGELMKKLIVQHLWSDVKNRMKKLGVSTASDLRRQLRLTDDSFKAAMVGYDEGLSDDRLLAGVLWRRLFFGKGDDICRLETMVAYVRRELARLDKLGAHQLFFSENIRWGPLIV